MSSTWRASTRSRSARATDPGKRPGVAGASFMAFFLAFWSRRSTATVVSASSNSQARSLAAQRRKSGYGSIVAVKRANA